MPKPRVNTRPGASAYEQNHEKIIEFASGDSWDAYEGGLIRFTRLGDGRLIVDLYSLSPHVEVRCDPAHLADRTPPEYPALPQHELLRPS